MTQNIDEPLFEVRSSTLDPATGTQLVLWAAQARRLRPVVIERYLDLRVSFKPRPLLDNSVGEA
jgi:hypothetical protein